MSEPFDLNKPPDRRLGMRQLIVLDTIPTGDCTPHYVKHDLAKQLALKILDNEAFFKVDVVEYYGQKTLHIRADCIVLTPEELIEIKREAFIRGVGRLSVLNGSTYR